MFNTKNSISIIILFLILGLLSQSVKIIPVGRTGVIFNLKGGVQNNILKEGLHFLIPFVQSLIVFDTRIITYSFSNVGTDEMRLGDPILAKTQDGQVVGIEVSIVTQMIQSRTHEVYQKLRTDYEQVLKAKIGKTMQEVIALNVADALYTEETRKKVTQEVFESLSASFLESGFELKDVLLRRIDFSPEYIEAIERKQIALQKAQLAQIRKEIAIKEKEIEIIKGEAKAKEVEIKGSAIQANPKVAELEYLDTIELSTEKIPVIMGIKGNTLLNLDNLMIKQ
jgi:regulator of protease activity HflC (stomatin/prohibitin superfamily)